MSDRELVLQAPALKEEVPALADVPASAIAVVGVPPAPALKEEVPAPALKEEVPAPALKEEVPAPALEEEVPALVEEEAPALKAMSPMAQLSQALSSMSLFEGQTKEQIVGIRQQVEAGLQAFNAIEGACQIMHDDIVAIAAIAAIKANGGVQFNPEIGHLSDFVDHCKLLVSMNESSAAAAAAAAVSESVKIRLEGFKEDSRFQKESYRLTVDQAKIGDIGVRISLVLRIGEVFNVPVFTVYILHNVFDNEKFNSEQAPQNILASPLTHNLKTIATCSRVDLMLELLLHATNPDPYNAVNVLIAHSMNGSIVSKFRGDSNPNEVIAAERAHFFDLLIDDNTHVQSLIVKALLIAIIQNPGVMTPDGKRFSDMFPSGQYVQYFGDVVYRATLKQGPILLPNVPNVPNERTDDDDDVGDAPGVEDVPLKHVKHEPMTRTDIIVAALTAVNDAMGRNANIVAAGGAAVSYYIADFVRDMHAGDFAGVIAESGLDLNALDALEQGCAGIPMNDIDCFVFGDVSRQFLMLFSLYMMILYANFYERPKQYGVKMTQGTRIQFMLSPDSDANIGLFMYGNNNEDANTKLISKRLKKNPKVQLVTQETKCFSQLSTPLCVGDLCAVDSYFTQPIDLVKKDIDDFLVLYESLYPEGEEKGKPDLSALLTSQYAANVDNMVSMKTTMLDLVCIFCNEDKALFIRIFMARKNHKDFARLRVFIEIYLLELLRNRNNDAAFLKHKAGLIDEIKQIRVMMRALNEKYYLEQGNIAAVHAATAEQLNADRAAFLTLLRSIGRKFVLIPDPLQNKIPAPFRKETGRRTIGFFEDDRKQMKYPFSMGRHMVALHGTYLRVSSRPKIDINHAYGMWLNTVFQEVPFIPKVEHAFREKMGEIIDKTQDQTYFEVGFSKMFVRSPEMLALLSRLNEVKGCDAMFKKGVTGKEKRTFSGKLLVPLRTFITKNGGAEPKASYVLKIYDTKLMDTLPAFVRSVIKHELEPRLLATINDPSEYDDAVREAIGRIILEWNRATSLKGGATRKLKRERVCKLTKRRRRVSKGKRRATRRKNKANSGKHARTRRA